MLYDAVILLTSRHGATALAAQPVVRDFVTDAYAHRKFIGYTGDASPLFEAAGLGGQTDDGCVNLDQHSAADFISRCAELRFWPLQASIATGRHGEGIRRPGLTDAGPQGTRSTARSSARLEESWIGRTSPVTPGNPRPACSAPTSTIISQGRQQAPSWRTG